MGEEEAVNEPTDLNGDNRGALLLSRNDLITPANRFYVQDYFFVKECVKYGEVETKKIAGKYNISDLLTKFTSVGVMQFLRPWMTGWDQRPLPDGNGQIK